MAPGERHVTCLMDTGLSGDLMTSGTPGWESRAKGPTASSSEQMEPAVQRGWQQAALRTEVGMDCS